MNSLLRQQAIDLRLKELSYGEIRKRLSVSKSTLSYWLRDFPLSEEKILQLRRKNWQKGEASRELFRLTMRKKREAAFQKVYEQKLNQFAKLSKETIFITGLMLYLAEGGKRVDSRLAIANTDPRVIKFFINWAMKFLAVNREEIRAQLHLYQNMDIDLEKHFWQNTLGLKEHQFYKPSVRRLQKSSFTYKESYRHGTCSIYIFGVERKREVTAAIKALMDRLEVIL